MTLKGWRVVKPQHNQKNWGTSDKYPKQIFLDKYEKKKKKKKKKII